MSVSAASFRPKVLKNFKRIFTLVSSSPKAEAGLQEEPFGFYTTDGSVVAYKTGANAVSAGAGIFVGGYFVGVADDNAPIGNNMPSIKY